MSKLEGFVKLVGSEFPEDRLTWQKRLATFHPETAEEAAAFIRLATRERQPLYITGFGNNIDPVGEPFANLVVVRTDRLNSVLEVSPEDLFIRVGAGYPLREVNVELARTGHYFPHAELPYVGSAAGAVAVNLTARLKGHDVPIKKYFLQAEVVTPEGELAKPGSICFKSVSGYDIVKIYAQSWGLLGLLVSVTFRIMPATAAEECRAMTMKPVDRTHFLSGLNESVDDPDVIYSRKIKSKLDPYRILPIVG
jgi:glycolate oxidase FAD binding subunit